MAWQMLMDGFEHYATVLDRWDEAWGAWYNGSWYNGPPTIGAWGRLGGGGLKFVYTEAGIKKTAVFGNQQEWAIAMAVNCGMPGRHYLFVLEDVSTPQVYAYLLDGVLKVCTGDPGDEAVVAQSSGPIVSLNSWNHIEVYIKLDGSAGIVEARLNGDSANPVIDETGLDTIVTANAYANVLVIGSEKWQAAMFGEANSRLADDVVVRAGSAFTGDARIICRVPTGAGTYTDWTPSTPPNWECVNEVPPNTTDGVQSNTVGHKDTYAHGPLPANTQSVLAVAVNHYTSKIEAGARKMKAVLDIGGSVLEGDEVNPPLGSYKHYQQVFVGPYTLAQADASQFGVKISS